MLGHLVTRRINAPVTVKVEGIRDVQIVVQPDGAHQYILSMPYDTALWMGMAKATRVPAKLYVGVKPSETYVGALGLIPGEEETVLVFMSSDEHSGENLSLRIKMPTKLFLEELK